MRLISGLFLLALFFLNPGWLAAQKPIGKVPAPRNIGDIQVFSLKDSILLAFYHKTGNILTRKNYWVWKDSTKQTTLSGVRNQRPLAVIQYRNKPCFYSLAGQGDILALQAGNEDSSRIVLSPTEFNGKIAGVFRDNALLIVTIDVETNKLTVFEISGFKVLSRKQFTMQHKVPDKMPLAIDEGDWLSVEKGCADYKLYKEGSKLTLIIDDVRNRQERFTMLLECDLATGQKHELKIPAWDVDLFRSSLSHGKLYRLAAQKEALDITIYDAHNGRMLSTQKIFNNDSFREQKVTARFNGIFLRRTDNLYDMIRTAPAGIPSVNVVCHATDSTQAELMVGTFINPHHMRQTIYINNPLATVVSFAVTAAINELTDKKGQTHYFYMLQNAAGKFERIQDDESFSTHAKIDLYEFTQRQRGAAYKFKGYLKTGNNVVGVYHLINEKKISMINFAARARVAQSE